jgi:hypothetical protein
MEYLDYHAGFLSHYGEFLEEVSRSLRRRARMQEIRLRQSGEWASRHHSATTPTEMGRRGAPRVPGASARSVGTLGLHIAVTHHIPLERAPLCGG